MSVELTDHVQWRARSIGHGACSVERDREPRSGSGLYALRWPDGQTAQFAAAAVANPASFRELRRTAWAMADRHRPLPAGSVRGTEAAPTLSHSAIADHRLPRGPGLYPLLHAPGSAFLCGVQLRGPGFAPGSMLAVPR